MLSESPITANSTTDNVYSGPHAFAQESDPSMNIEQKKRDRYVRIFLKDSREPLHMGEVQVFAK